LRRVLSQTEASGFRVWDFFSLGAKSWTGVVPTKFDGSTNLKRAAGCFGRRYGRAHCSSAHIHRTFELVDTFAKKRQGKDRKVEILAIKNLATKLDMNPRSTKAVAIVLVCVITLAGGACGGGSGGGDQGSSSGDSSSGGSEKSTASRSSAYEEATTVSGGEKTASEKADPEQAELARAQVGKKEITNMIPADGKRPDTARPLPENPPDEIEVYPATTNRSVKGSIRYDRRPPTNGDHASIWQNCGFYGEPIQDPVAVHSLDHGVVWITYRPDLPPGQVDKLRPYGEENYVIVSPYPGQDAPVNATSWRVQLKLDGAGDPQLRKFVHQFRISEIAPLSGNRCVGGVGRPAV
jgi:Protein of unknown function (DUF3105)